MKVRAMALIILTLGLIAGTVGAGPPKADIPGKKIETEVTTVVGENYCLGCSLKKERGAAAQCSVYGHRHALKVESANAADGKPLPVLAGQTLHYLDNDKSAPLVRGEKLHGKRVEVKGKLFGPERTLEVLEVKVR